MTKDEKFKALRWALTPVAAVFGFGAALVLALPLNHFVYSLLLSDGYQLANKPFIDYVMRYDGAHAASLVLLCGTLMAPAYRPQVASTLLLVGGLLAWVEVGNWFSPIYHMDGPVREWSPLIGTCLGGLATCAALCFAFRSKMRHGGD